MQNFNNSNGSLLLLYSLPFPVSLAFSHTCIPAMCLRVCFAIAISISVTVVARLYKKFKETGLKDLEN